LSSGAQQQQSELPVNAILPYLSLNKLSLHKYGMFTKETI